MENLDVRRTGVLAVASGLLGLLGVGLLIGALAAPTPAPDSMRRATSLFAWQNAAVVLQALMMIPVTLGLFQAGRNLNRNGDTLTASIGLLGQITLVLAAGLLFTGTVSDMLYMAPIGLVGVWLLLISRKTDETSTRAIVWTGRVAGVGLVLVGAGFVIYGALVAPAVFMRPLSNAEIDAQSLTTPNLIAHVCMALGTLLGRLIYPIWAIILGRRMVRLAAS